MQVELFAPGDRRVDRLVLDAAAEVLDVEAALDLADDFVARLLDDLFPVGRRGEGGRDVADGDEDDDGVLVGGSGAASGC